MVDVLFAVILYFRFPDHPRYSIRKTPLKVKLLRFPEINPEVRIFSQAREALEREITKQLGQAGNGAKVMNDGL
ncbi:MAG: hypothetical protein DMG65_01685 [Candidatus Angelobacter sp. Gp1-AA117]|nr:MAG: hypothetical protein DMG65_01685 [Candidatus Angelobacter sp. Gp1-AA117]